MKHTLSKPLLQLPDPLPLTPVAAASPAAPTHPFDLTIRPPGSKSLTNRALLLAALAHGRSTIRRPLLDADDAERMIDALRLLGADIARDTATIGSSADLHITGVNGRWRISPSGLSLNLNNAGTATRFLAAAALLAPAPTAGPITIDGNARMRERPIAELADALTQLGARVEYPIRPGFPPIQIHAPAHLLSGSQNPHGFSARFGTTQSGQFISALLMLGPWLHEGITLHLTGAITSASYIEMTLGLLSRLGANVRMSHDLHILRVGPPLATSTQSPTNTTTPRGLSAFDYTVEPDASGATYFWAAAALIPGAGLTIPGLGPASLQGDSNFPNTLERMGVGIIRSAGSEPSIQIRGPAQLHAIDADMIDMPDAAMTLAAVACFAPGTTILRGLRTLRVKETDRIAAMKNELTKLGVRIDSPIGDDPDAIAITPPIGGLDCSPSALRVDFDTYDDHRMAMSLALIGLRRPNVFIRNPGCVAKTYPTFWNDWAMLYSA